VGLDLGMTGVQGRGLSTFARETTPGRGGRRRERRSCFAFLSEKLKAVLSMREAEV